MIPPRFATPRAPEPYRKCWESIPMRRLSRRDDEARVMAQATWHTLKCEAVRWRRLKKSARAIECLLQAIEMTQESPDLSRETGSMLNYLADLYLQEGQLAQAEATIR